MKKAGAEAPAFPLGPLGPFQINPPRAALQAAAPVFFLGNGVNAADPGPGALARRVEDFGVFEPHQIRCTAPPIISATRARKLSQCGRM